MIAKITRYGGNAAGLIRYLYHAGLPGDAPDPHMIAGWPTPAELEPARRRDDRRDVKRLTELLEQTTAALGGSGSARPVWHCVMRAAPEDRPLSDGEWAQIASDVMDRTGLSRYEEEDDGVPVGCDPPRCRPHPHRGGAGPAGRRQAEPVRGPLPGAGRLPGCRGTLCAAARNRGPFRDTA